MQDCRINGKKVRISVLPTEKRRKGADQKEKFKKDGKKASFEKLQLSKSTQTRIFRKQKQLQA